MHRTKNLFKVETYVKIFNQSIRRVLWKINCMSQPPTQQITRLLLAWRDGNKSALDELMPLVYNELHRLAKHYMNGQNPGNTLQTSALVNEAYLRLVDSSQVHWQDRNHFFAISAQLMRRILVDSARARNSLKRGGDVQKNRTRRNIGHGVGTVFGFSRTRRSSEKSCGFESASITNC